MYVNFNVKLGHDTIQVKNPLNPSVVAAAAAAAATTTTTTTTTTTITRVLLGFKYLNNERQ